MAHFIESDSANKQIQSKIYKRKTREKKGWKKDKMKKKLWSKSSEWLKTESNSTRTDFTLAFDLCINTFTVIWLGDFLKQTN